MMTIRLRVGVSSISMLGMVRVSRKRVMVMVPVGMLSHFLFRLLLVGLGVIMSDVGVLSMVRVRRKSVMVMGLEVMVPVGMLEFFLFLLHFV